MWYKTFVITYNVIVETCNSPSDLLNLCPIVRFCSYLPTSVLTSLYWMFCRSESSLEQLQFDARLFDGYNGILRADEVTVDDITYEVLDQLYVLIITFFNNLYFY